MDVAGALRVVDLAARIRSRLAGRARWRAGRGRPVRGLAYGGSMAGVKSVWQAVELGDGVSAFGQLYNGDGRNRNDMTGPSAPAASVARLGRGRIAGVYLDLGERYANAATTLARELLPEPVVEVAGSHLVDVTVGRLDGRLIVHLVNTGGPHSNAKVHVLDEIPSVGPLTVTIRAARPRAVTLQPGDRPAEWSYTEPGLVRVTLPRVEIHEAVVLE